MKCNILVIVTYSEYSIASTSIFCRNGFRYLEKESLQVIIMNLLFGSRDQSTQSKIQAVFPGKIKHSVAALVL